MACYTSDPSASSSSLDFDDPDLQFAANITADSQCNCSDPRFWFIEVCNCDYPVDESADLQDSLPLGFVYSLVFLVGVLGNLAVIVGVSRHKKLRSVTNYFLASLSTSDLCLILFCIPVQVGFVRFSFVL